MGGNSYNQSPALGSFLYLANTHSTSLNYVVDKPLSTIITSLRWTYSCGNNDRHIVRVFDVTADCPPVYFPYTFTRWYYNWRPLWNWYVKSKNRQLVSICISYVTSIIKSFSYLFVFMLPVNNRCPIFYSGILFPLTLKRFYIWRIYMKEIAPLSIILLSSLSFHLTESIFSHCLNLLPLLYTKFMFVAESVSRLVLLFRWSSALLFLCQWILFQSLRFYHELRDLVKQIPTPFSFYFFFLILPCC